jgi:O-methyltransferase
MVKNAHLVSLYNLVREADKQGLRGDLVECGVWNGGSAALMAAATRSCRYNLEERSLWLFDSFEGLPPPGDKDGTKAINAYFAGRCKGDAKKVEKAFATINLSTAGVTIVPGWFETTLEQASIDEIALLHIDADWYDSVRLVLDIFYDRVAPGGFIVLDDYGFWPGCSKAVHDFLRERDISDDVITMVGEHGAYFQKPQSHAAVDGCPPLDKGGLVS